MRSGLRAQRARLGALLASLATLSSAATAFATVPAIAAEVHARGGYPSEIEIRTCQSGVCTERSVGIAIGGEGRRGRERGSGSGERERGGGASAGDDAPGRGGRAGENEAGQNGEPNAANPSSAGAQSQDGRGEADGLGDEAGSPGASGAERARERARRREERKRAKVPESVIVIPGGSGFASMLALIVVVAVLVAFFVLLLSRSRPRGADSTAIEPGTLPAPAARDTPFTLEDFDALANAGRLDQAVLALLLHALSVSGWRAEGTGRSRTAREVVSGLVESDPRRALLSEIVALAEAVRFGGAAATRERFDAMRARFEHLRGGRA